MIDRTTIDKIFEAVRIEEVVSDYVTLRKRGVNYIGLCPFHDEKTPSFTVSPAKGICKCFGCGKGGNSVNFIMELEQFSYVEALKMLGKKYNIEIQDQEMSAEQIQSQNTRESMLIINEYAQSTFTKQLLESEEGRAIGLSYFKQRGFNEAIINKFQLGYCLEKRDAFAQTAIAKGYKLDYLVKTGLTIQGENYTADRFRGRVMFPIHGLSGKVQAFGGRILKSDAKTAKYLNSPESEVYHKSRVLYGIFQAKRDVVKQDRCFLVEGYTDVIAFHQAGIENVVASSGTALTPDQIRLIKRFTENITVIYDGDAAGIKASIRGIDLILEQGMNVKTLLLPDGEDPDSFAKSMNATALIEYIDTHQTDFIHFKTQLLLKDAQNDPVKKAQLLSDIVRSIAIIPNQITRSIYIKECSSLLEIREDVLYSEITKIKLSHRAESQKRQVAPKRSDARLNASATEDAPVENKITKGSPEEVMMLKFLLKHGSKQIIVPVFEDEHVAVDQENPEMVNVMHFIVNALVEDELTLSHKIYQQIIDICQENLDNESFNPETYFIQNSDPMISQTTADLTAQQHELSQYHFKSGSVESEEDKLSELVPRIVFEYKRKILDTYIKSTLDQMQKSKDMAEIMELQRTLSSFNELKKMLGKFLGDRIVL